MADKRSVPTPDEVEAWASGPTKRKGRIRRLFARKTIDVGEGVGEAASKVEPRRVAVEQHDSTPPAEVPIPQTSGPRPIAFASGLLEHEDSHAAATMHAEPEVAFRAGDAAAESDRSGVIEEQEEPASHAETPAPQASPPRAIGFAPGLEGKATLRSAETKYAETGVAFPVPRPAVLRLGEAGGDTSPARDEAPTADVVLEVAGFTLLRTGLEQREEGPTPTEEDVEGTARIYRVLGPEGVNLDLGDIAWDNGERSLTILAREPTSPPGFDGLVRRLRMTVQVRSQDEQVVELSAARLKSRSAVRPSLMKADLHELSREAGIDMINVLTQAGASRVGTKEEVLDVHHQRRAYWCATYSPDELDVPAVAFFLMRVVALHSQLQSSK